MFKNRKKVGCVFCALIMATTVLGGCANFFGSNEDSTDYTTSEDASRGEVTNTPSDTTEGETTDMKDPTEKTDKIETSEDTNTETETGTETEEHTTAIDEGSSTNWKPGDAYVLSDEAPSGADGSYVFRAGVVHAGIGIVYAGKGQNAEKTIVIDAGHQLKGMSEKEPNAPGSDVMKAKVTSGTTGSFTGIPEHELNLAVSLLLRDCLVARGYRVVMVRETAEVSISNKERAELANAAIGDGEGVLVRIHANGSENASVRGALTICQTANNQTATRYKESRALSEAVLDAFCDKTELKKRSIWETDTMTGINWCTVPSVIVEMGFMTNREEDEIMATTAFRSAAAEGIAEGIDQYYALVQK